MCLGGARGGVVGGGRRVEEEQGGPQGQCKKGRFNK